MTQRKRVAQRAIEKLEKVKLEQGAELSEIMADVVKNSPKSISFVPAKVKPEFQAEVDQMVAVAEARKARSDAQQVAANHGCQCPMCHSEGYQQAVTAKITAELWTGVVVPAGFVLVPTEAMLSIKSRVNTLATLSLKAERYSVGREIKQGIADMLAAAPQPPQGEKT